MQKSGPRRLRPWRKDQGRRRGPSNQPMCRGTGWTGSGSGSAVLADVLVQIQAGAGTPLVAAAVRGEPAAREQAKRVGHRHRLHHRPEAGGTGSARAHGIVLVLGQLLAAPGPGGGDRAAAVWAHHGVSHWPRHHSGKSASGGGPLDDGAVEDGSVDGSALGVGSGSSPEPPPIPGGGSLLLELGGSGVRVTVADGVGPALDVGVGVAVGVGRGVSVVRRGGFRRTTDVCWAEVGVGGGWLNDRGGTGGSLASSGGGTGAATASGNPR